MPPIPRRLSARRAESERFALRCRGGKRGSARVLYLYVPTAEIVYLILAYGKDVKDSISKSEKKQLKALAAALKEE